MRYGTGRPPPVPLEIITLMRHRRRQLMALNPRPGDPLAAELESLDRDIAAGLVELEARTEEERRVMADRLEELVREER